MAKINHCCINCNKDFLGIITARFCPDCRKIRQKEKIKEWYKNNQKHHSKITQKWYKKYPEKRRLIQKKRYLKLKQNNQNQYQKELQKCRDYYAKNREKCLVQKQIYYIKNSDILKVKHKNYRMNNKDKIIAQNIKSRTREQIDPELVKLIFKLFDYECMYCRSKRNLTLEHILPITRGGDSNFENLGIACSSCNSAKGNKTIVEFKDYLELKNKILTED